MGKGGVGSCAFACPLPARTGWRGQRERGGAGGVVSSCAPSWEGRGWGERERAAAACPCTHPFWRGGGTEGEGAAEGLRGETAACPRAHSFRANVRMGREAPGREGEVGGADRGQGEPGVTARRDDGVPTRGPGGDGVPSCAAFPRERGGVDRGAGEGKRRGRLTPRAMKGKGWATGMGGGREGEWRRGEGMRRRSLHSRF
ncbi:hypothetical protein EDB85DRAFT_2056578, partial [Lactarius pseudohatsudake]